MFVMVVAALVAGAGVQVASPLVVRAFLDLARTGAAVERLVAVAALFIGVALAGSALEIVRSHAGAVLAWQAMNNLRHRLFRHTIDLAIPSLRVRLPATCWNASTATSPGWGACCLIYCPSWPPTC